MVLMRKLPSELEEEILIRVPPLSLPRFRAVCKQWNALYNDTIFINNHLACAHSRSEFVLQADSKIYSVSFNPNDDDPNINVRELTSVDNSRYCLVNCDGFFYSYKTTETAAVWNPWLRQTRLIDIHQMPKPFDILGMGYDSSRPEKSYKIVGSTRDRYVIYEFATNAWRSIDDTLHPEKSTKVQYAWYNNVSLNGNLYWTAYNLETRQCFILILDCSKEIFKPFCFLPCTKKHSSNTSHVLAVFKGDRFSLLEHCRITGEIEIWVTKKKITNGDDVEWIKFMSVSKPNLPKLYVGYFSRYLVDDTIYGKSFFTCCRDETRQACVYIVRGNMRRKITLDDVVGDLRGCSVYIPTLMIIP